MQVLRGQRDLPHEGGPVAVLLGRSELLQQLQLRLALLHPGLPEGQQLGYLCINGLLHLCNCGCCLWTGSSSSSSGSRVLVLLHIDVGRCHGGSVASLRSNHRPHGSRKPYAWICSEDAGMSCSGLGAMPHAKSMTDMHSTHRLRGCYALLA